MAVKAWRMMGNTMDWTALPIVVEIFGVDDVESFINRLLAIREFMDRG